MTHRLRPRPPPYLLELGSSRELEIACVRPLSFRPPSVQRAAMTRPRDDLSGMNFVRPLLLADLRKIRIDFCFKIFITFLCLLLLAFFQTKYVTMINEEISANHTFTDPKYSCSPSFFARILQVGSRTCCIKVDRGQLAED